MSKKVPTFFKPSPKLLPIRIRVTAVQRARLEQLTAAIEQVVMQQRECLKAIIGSTHNPDDPKLAQYAVSLEKDCIVLTPPPKPAPDPAKPKS